MCVEVNIKNSCFIGSTEEYDRENQSREINMIYYIQKQQIKLQQNQILKGFYLKSKQSNNTVSIIYYEYIFCKLN